MAPGASVKLTVLRKGEEKTVTLTLGELPNQREARAERTGAARPDRHTGLPRLGLTLAPAGQVAGSGRRRAWSPPSIPTGLPPSTASSTGDVILDVGGKTVASPADVRKALADARKEGKRTVLMRVKSGDATKFVALPLGRA